MKGPKNLFQIVKTISENLQTTLLESPAACSGDENHSFFSAPY
jgi:hypothetical protein